MYKKVIVICATALLLVGCNSKIKDAVRAKLKIPSSAKFENIVKLGSRACVVFNAKNPMGVYAGVSTAQLVNLGANDGVGSWYVESIDHSNCSKFELEAKLKIDAEDKASEQEVLHALIAARLVSQSTTDVSNVAYGKGPCASFVSDILTDARVSHSIDNAERKARLKDEYESGLAQIKRGICKPINGVWTVRTKKSAIDDSTNVYLSVNSTNSVHSGYDSAQPSLNIRCAQGQTSVYIDWGLYLGIDDTYMLSRLDKEPATTKSWSISTDNKAVFAPGNEAAFAKELMSHKQLIARITPYGEDPVMATFPLGSLTHAIEPLRKACHW